MNKVLQELNLPGNEKFPIVCQRNQSEKELRLQMELDLEIPEDNKKGLEE